MQNDLEVRSRHLTTPLVQRPAKANPARQGVNTGSTEISDQVICVCEMDRLKEGVLTCTFGLVTEGHSVIN